MRIKSMSKPKKLEPVSPGEMLLEEFLKPLGISQYRLAKEIGVPAQRIGEIVAGRRHADFLGQPVLRNTEWLQKFIEQYFAG